NRVFLVAAFEHVEPGHVETAGGDVVGHVGQGRQIGSCVCREVEGNRRRPFGVVPQAQGVLVAVDALVGAGNDPEPCLGHPLDGGLGFTGCGVQDVQGVEFVDDQMLVIDEPRIVSGSGGHGVDLFPGGGVDDPDTVGVAAALQGDRHVLAARGVDHVLCGAWVDVPGTRVVRSLLGTVVLGAGTRGNVVGVGDSGGHVVLGDAFGRGDEAAGGREGGVHVGGGFVRQLGEGFLCSPVPQDGAVVP